MPETMMSSASLDLWRRAAIVFESALDREAGERAAFVDRVCGNEPELHRAVSSLLASDPESEGRYATGPVDSEVEERASGQLCGSYRLGSVLGAGGMSTVYQARRVDGEVEHQVAVKLLRDGISSPMLLRMLRRERQILADLEHPNIARFIDGGTTDAGRPFLVLEFVEGARITDYCEARRMDVRGRLALFQKVLGAVSHAHRNLIVHRDLKPSNLLVTDQGEPKLLDFGIAKLLHLPLSGEAYETTATQDRFLTPGFASPEQIAGRPVSTASDLYSLGVLLYLLLTGHMPRSDPRQADARIPPPSERFAPTRDERTSLELCARARGGSTEQLRRQLRGDLDNIVLRCLRADPADRYPSVDQLAEDLERYAQGRVVLAQPPSAWYRMRKFVGRNRLYVLAGLVAVLALGGSFVSSVRHAAELAEERDAARRAQNEAEELASFLTSAFRLASPYEIEGPESDVSSSITVREVLDASAERIHTALADQPLLQARLLDTIGLVYGDLGALEPAMEALRKALEIRQQAHGGDHLDVVESFNSLAVTLGWLGRPAEAEELLQRALAMARRLPGEKDGELAVTLDNLSRLAFDRGDYGTAEELQLETLAIRRRLEIPPARGVAVALIQLGEIAWQQLDLTAAESQLREGMRVLETVVGPEHPDVATVLNNLGWILAEQGDVERGENLLRRGLAMRRKVQGEEHGETISSLAELGSFLLAYRDSAQAEPILHQVLELDRRVKGAEHPDVASTLNNLGMAILERGDAASAAPLLAEAVRIATLAWGEEHRRRITYLQNLGRIEHELGDLPAAEAKLRQGLTLRLRLLGPESVGVGISRTSLADILGSGGCSQEAIGEARAAVQGLSSALDTEHWRVQVARSVLGKALLGCSQRVEAEPLLRSSVEALETSRGPQSRPARHARQRAAALDS